MTPTFAVLGYIKRLRKYLKAALKAKNFKEKNESVCEAAHLNSSEKFDTL